MSPLKEVVGPQDCAFLVGVPITRDGFLQALTCPDKDFVHGQFGESPLSPEAKWSLYRPTAQAIGDLLDSLCRKRVRVIEAAHLSDFVAEQSSARAVVLFTHWRSGLLRVCDVAWESLPDDAADAKFTKIVELLHADRTGDAVARTAIVASINEVLIHEALGDHPWFGLASGQTAASLEHRVFMNRKFVDAALPGVFRRGTSVEFADGMSSIETVADAVRSDYTGIFDLSVCNSILLAELIKEQARNCLVIAEDLPAVVDFQVEFYKGLFKMLNGRSYIESTTLLRHLITREIRRKL